MNVLEYTTALMELASLEKQGREVADDLEFVLNLYRSEPGNLDDLKAFKRALGKKELTKITGNFIGVLIKEKNQKLFPYICAHYWRLICKKEFDALVNVTVTSAVPLDEKQRSAIRSRLVGRLKTDLAIRYVIDPEILGGLVVQAGDMFMNYSVSRELELLERSISQKKRYI